jgi:hypothetical protein
MASADVMAITKWSVSDSEIPLRRDRKTALPDRMVMAITSAEALAASRDCLECVYNLPNQCNR